MLTYYPILADIYTKKSNYKKANAFYKKYFDLSKSLKKEEREKIALELEQKYQVEKRELENALLKSQKRENETIINAQRVKNELLAEQVVLETKLNTELERSNQDLENFAHIASHDIKAPIKTIGNFSGLLKQTAMSVSYTHLTLPTICSV